MAAACKQDAQTVPTAGYGTANAIVPSGATVAEARTILDVPTDCLALIGNIGAHDSHVLQPGEHVEFTSRAPELG